ncbi:hypothetical protein H6G04_33335 [Calothrix membranacea FACHB-236]|nr:hypothetical protein [Calothrix membranacea FACHB-236]
MSNSLVVKNRRAWDFDPALDTNKSYQAFCIYRDLGVDRSLGKTARTLSKSEGLINRWSTAGNWKQRAIDFDIFNEEIQRDLERKTEIDDHKNKLIRFRSFCEKLGWESLELACDCLEVSKNALKLYKETPHERLKPFEIKALANAGTSSAEIGQTLLCEALAVSKLLELLPIDIEAENVEE